MSKESCNARWDEKDQLFTHGRILCICYTKFGAFCRGPTRFHHTTSDLYDSTTVLRLDAITESRTIKGSLNVQIRELETVLLSASREMSSNHSSPLHQSLYLTRRNVSLEKTRILGCGRFSVNLSRPANRNNVETKRSLNPNNILKKWVSPKP